MSAVPPLRSADDPPASVFDSRPGIESAFDTRAWEDRVGRPLGHSRWIGWRLRLLVLTALLGCVGLFLLIRALATEPGLNAQWRADAQGMLELAASDDPRLHGLAGAKLMGVLDRDGKPVPLDALLLQRSPRWLVDDADRARHAQLHQGLAQALDRGTARFVFADGPVVALEPRPRGIHGLGAMFWLMSALALLLYLVAMVVLLARPSARSSLYGLMSLCQAGNLLFIAIESIPGLGLVAGLAPWDYPTRAALDLVTAAAVVHATGAHPHAVRWRLPLAAAAWFGAGTFIALNASGNLPHAWWWTQGGVAALGMLAIAQLGWSYQLEPNPAAVLLRRFSVVALGTWVLLTAGIAASEQLPSSLYDVAAVGSVIWALFLASLLALLPFMSRSQQMMREFSMLAGVSTVATSLDLLFVAVFSLGQFASLTLALFLSLGVYAGVRQWILNQMMGSNMLTTERMFEQLYRMARDVESQPEKVGERLSHLLREFFEPIEVLQIERASRRARVVADGSTLLVPVPPLTGDDQAVPCTIVLRFAHRGKRLFTPEDARLTDRVVEQLKRAVAYDRAVEQGRGEERVRLAQDLHDDIGARLLTLMYQAHSPEMEEYVRHTLQDLKTLTRGLAAANHRLTHAAAEWKADISQRLTAAHCDLGWSFSLDSDMALSVVQWSALTRVLRELVSNAISHARATRVDIEGVFDGGRLTLQVSDNGRGRDPQAWSHGLGLGGVRKRVKQLGGDVEWRENTPQGICCQVSIPRLNKPG
jgi:signal transduction histidine kinase